MCWWESGQCLALIKFSGSGMLGFRLFLTFRLGFLEIVIHFYICFCVVKNLFSTQQNVSESRSNNSGFIILNVIEI